MELLAALVVGLIVGGVACWWVQAYRARETVAGLRGQLERTDNAKQVVNAATEQLRDIFQATASQALQNNNDLFMNVAGENLGKTLESAKGDFKQRHEQFEALVKPLTESYGKLSPQIESLIKQNQSLAVETGKLSSALTNNRQIGSWGEIQLRRVVEMAGMTEHCDFTEQTTAADSQDRPDLTVKLPDRRTVVVDAKASTVAYLEAQQAGDEAAKDTALKRHAGALRSQVDALASKDYGARVEGSLDFVVMFVPGDQFLSAALNATPNLIEHAMAKRVAIATPMSLVSLLWTVANGWQRYRIAEDAEAILEAGGEMLQRMRRFITDYQKVGKRLGLAVDAFNGSIGAYDSRVVPAGRRFARLIGGAEEHVEGPPVIEKSVATSKYAEEGTTGQPTGRSRNLIGGTNLPFAKVS